MSLQSSIGMRKILWEQTLPTVRAGWHRMFSAPFLIQCFGCQRARFEALDFGQLPRPVLKATPCGRIAASQQMEGVERFKVAFAIAAPDAALLIIVDQLQVLAGGKRAAAATARYPQIADVDDCHATTKFLRLNRRVFLLVGHHSPKISGKHTVDMGQRPLSAHQFVRYQRAQVARKRLDSALVEVPPHRMVERPRRHILELPHPVTQHQAAQFRGQVSDEPVRQQRRYPG